jgi:NADH-quinone oxidoreductase subunit H
MLGYDITVSIVLFSLVIQVGSLNITNLVIFQESIIFLVVYPLVFIGALVNGLAETNRVPFDLPEAESELVSGYNTEYSGVGFTLFFLAEYSSMLVMAYLLSLLFIGG